jgi:MoxR-like ATPase
MDRFMICTAVGYPDRTAERMVFDSHRLGEPVDALNPVLNISELIQLQELVREVTVEDTISDYILDLTAATRKHKELSLGVSTRGALALYRAAQALALVEGRQYAIPDDVKRLALPVMAHRVVCSGMIREGQRARARQIVQQIVDTTRVPN